MMVGGREGRRRVNLEREEPCQSSETRFNLDLTLSWCRHNNLDGAGAMMK